MMRKRKLSRLPDIRATTDLPYSETIRLLENLYVFLMQKLSEAGISKASNTSDITFGESTYARELAISPKPTTKLYYGINLGAWRIPLICIYFI
jgi:hypothetical protein